jgi:hypothetical protein
MAGRGPAPKDPNKRARKNSDPIPLRVVHKDPATQPELADLLGETNPLTGGPWHQATLRFWQHLAEFPTTTNLQDAQWSSLARAMMIDDAMVSGETKLAAESRLRLAKYGIDPDDLARLRIQIVQADEAEEKRGPAGGQAARQRRGPLTG